MLDELAHAGRENLDPEHVERYDAKEDADADAEVRLLVGLGLGPTSRVIDIGAGTGQFVVAAARRCDRVTAVDVSPVMLDRLRIRLEDRGVSNVETVRSGVLTFEHRDQPVDFVYSRYALHHLPDLWKAVALARINAVLRPGGILRVWDIVYGFGPAEATARLEAWCATGGEAVGTGWTRAELEEHVRDEHSTFTWLFEPMLRRAGFTIEDAAYTDDQISAKYVLRKIANGA
jgi:ubiquinone/menaquinone biosynthesis C-methylase UbiE